MKRKMIILGTSFLMLLGTTTFAHKGSARSDSPQSGKGSLNSGRGSMDSGSGSKHADPVRLSHEYENREHRQGDKQDNRRLTRQTSRRGN